MEPKKVSRCTFCNKWFGSFDVMNQHRAKHHGLRRAHNKLLTALSRHFGKLPKREGLRQIKELNELLEKEERKWN